MLQYDFLRLFSCSLSTCIRSTRILLMQFFCRRSSLSPYIHTEQDIVLGFAAVGPSGAQLLGYRLGIPTGQYNDEFVRVGSFGSIFPPSSCCSLRWESWRCLSTTIMPVANGDVGVSRIILHVIVDKTSCRLL